MWEPQGVCTTALVRIAAVTARVGSTHQARSGLRRRRRERWRHHNRIGGTITHPSIALLQLRFYGILRRSTRPYPGVVRVKSSERPVGVRPRTRRTRLGERRAREGRKGQGGIRDGALLQIGSFSSVVGFGGARYSAMRGLRAIAAAEAGWYHEAHAFVPGWGGAFFIEFSVLSAEF